MAKSDGTFIAEDSSNHVVNISKDVNFEVVKQFIDNNQNKFLKSVFDELFEKLLSDAIKNEYGYNSEQAKLIILKAHEQASDLDWYNSILEEVICLVLFIHHYEEAKSKN